MKEGRKIKRSAYYKADSTSGMVMRHLYVSPCIYRRPLPPPQPLCAPSTVFDIPFLSSSPSPSSHPSIFPYHYEILLSPPPTRCSLTFVPRTLVSFLGGKLGKGKIRPLLIRGTGEAQQDGVGRGISSSPLPLPPRSAPLAFKLLFPNITFVCCVYLFVCLSVLIRSGLNTIGPKLVLTKAEKNRGGT